MIRHRFSTLTHWLAAINLKRSFEKAMKELEWKKSCSLSINQIKAFPYSGIQRWTAMKLSALHTYSFFATSGVLMSGYFEQLPFRTNKWTIKSIHNLLSTCLLYHIIYMWRFATCHLLCDSILNIICGFPFIFILN